MGEREGGEGHERIEEDMRKCFFSILFPLYNVPWRTRA